MEKTQEPQPSGLTPAGPLSVLAWPPSVALASLEILPAMAPTCWARVTIPNLTLTTDFAFSSLTSKLKRGPFLLLQPRSALLEGYSFSRQHPSSPPPLG